MTRQPADVLRKFADQAPDVLKPATPDGYQWGGSLIELRAALLLGAAAIEGAHDQAFEVMRVRAFEKTVRALAQRLPDSTVGAAVEFFDAGLAAVFTEAERVAKEQRP
jgi:hypothetical protein